MKIKIGSIIKLIIGLLKSSKIIKGDVGKVIDRIDPDIVDIFVPNSLVSTSKILPVDEVDQKMKVDHSLPASYSWIKSIGLLPKTMTEILKFCGLLEYKSKYNNPTILSWATELGVSSYYNADSIPWCGLGQAIGVKRAGYSVPPNFLAAKSWLRYGDFVPLSDMSFGDIVVLNRDNNPALGHVGRYIGETDQYVCLYGANQFDSWCFAWFSKSRIAGVRRDPFKVGAPTSVKKYKLLMSGKLSKNEV